MTLQEKMDAYKKDFLTKVPKEALKVIHRATEQLANSGLVEQAIQVGSAAPQFTLKNSSGEAQSLSGLLANGPMVLTFYRGKW